MGFQSERRRIGRKGERGRKKCRREAREAGTERNRKTLFKCLRSQHPGTVTSATHLLIPSDLPDAYSDPYPYWVNIYRSALFRLRSYVWRMINGGSIPLWNCGIIARLGAAHLTGHRQSPSEVRWKNGIACLKPHMP